MLGWLGAQVAEEPFITLSQACTAYYFVYLIVILKITQELEYYFIVTCVYGPLSLPKDL
jgi:hypothetical protein